MEKVYNKLVRDNIPHIIKENGQMPITRILEIDEYKKELEKKFYEEYEEVIQASNSEERIEELADVLEIIRSLAKIENKTLEDIINMANQKNKKRGSFDDMIFLEKVIENNN